MNSSTLIHAAISLFIHETMSLGIATPFGVAGMSVAGSPSQRVSVFEERTVQQIMLWTILMVILVLWLLGLIGGVGGSLIHLLLIIAAVVLILQLVTGRRAVV